MKATYKATIKNISKDSCFVDLTLNCHGKIEDTKLVGDARNSSAEMVVRLKPAVADQMKLGAIITITITDDEEQIKDLG